MELIEQIKQLEKKAKENEYYKDRYFALSKEIEVAIKGLSDLIGIVDKPKKAQSSHGGDYTSPKIRKCAEKLIERLKLDDTLQVGTKEIEQHLISNGIKDHAINVQGVRQVLNASPEISTRKDGKKIYYYYSGTKLQEQKEAAIKFGKVSFMG